MAMFRKLFYKKPPDGLLEISDRVYVFDCCFTTDIWEESNYKGYVGNVTSQLREYYPDAAILVFNFKEGNSPSQMANVLSEYDMIIMDYPRQYEGCPLLTMEMIHHFLRSSESWLSLGNQNVLLMHCERGGWPVLAFMLAALLIYRKQYSGEQKTLDMVHKQAPRELLQLLSPLNPIPSQLRYLQYVSRRNVGSEWPPQDRALTFDCIIIRMIPDVDGQGGCRPLFRVYGPDPVLGDDKSPKVLFSTPKKSKTVRYYKQAECALVKIDINCNIQGDVVLECISLHDDMEREVMVFRVMFNTAFIRSNILIVSRDDVDTLWDAKNRLPKDFRVEVLFSEMDAIASIVPLDLSSSEEKDGLPIEAFAKVHEMFSSVDWASPNSEVALNALQQITVSNIEPEKLEAESDQTTEITKLSKEESAYREPQDAKRPLGSESDSKALADHDIQEMIGKVDVPDKLSLTLKDHDIQETIGKSDVPDKLSQHDSEKEMYESIEQETLSKADTPDKLSEHHDSEKEMSESIEQETIDKADVPGKLSEHHDYEKEMSERMEQETICKADVPDKLSEHHPSGKEISESIEQETIGKADVPDKLSKHHDSEKEMSESIEQESIDKADIPSKLSEQHDYEKEMSERMEQETICKADVPDELPKHRASGKEMSESIEQETIGKADVPDKLSKHHDSEKEMSESIEQESIGNADVPDKMSEHHDSEKEMSESTEQETIGMVDVPDKLSEHHDSKKEMSEITEQEIIGMVDVPDKLSEYHDSEKEISESIEQETTGKPNVPDKLSEHHDSEKEMSESIEQETIGKADVPDKLSEHHDSEKEMSENIEQETIGKADVPDKLSEHHDSEKEMWESIEQETINTDVGLPESTGETQSPKPFTSTTSEHIPIDHLTPPLKDNIAIKSCLPQSPPRVLTTSGLPISEHASLISSKDDMLVVPIPPSPPPIYSSSTDHESSKTKSSLVPLPPAISPSTPPLKDIKRPPPPPPTPPTPPPLPALTLNDTLVPTPPRLPIALSKESSSSVAGPLPLPLKETSGPGYGVLPPFPAPLLKTSIPTPPIDVAGLPPPLKDTSGPAYGVPPAPPLKTSVPTLSPLVAPSKESSSSVTGPPPPPPPPLKETSGSAYGVPPPPPAPPLKTSVPTPPIPPSKDSSSSVAGPPPPPPPQLKETSGSAYGVPPAPPLKTSVPTPPIAPSKDSSSSVAGPPPPPPPPLKETSGSAYGVPPPPSAPPLKTSVPTRPIPPSKESSSSMAGPPPPPPPPLKDTSGPGFGVPPPPRPPSSNTAGPPPPPPPMLSSSTNSSAPPPPAPPAKQGNSSIPPPPPPNSSMKSSPNVGCPSPPPPSILPPGSKGRPMLSRAISKTNQGKKLKPLHWLKLTRAVSGSLWAETQKCSDASRTPEIDISELESLFSAVVPTSDQGRKAGSRSSLGQKPEIVQLIDHRRAYNCEIMLSKVKIPLHDLLTSVLALEDSALDVDQVENLIKFCPTKEEMELLKGYKGDKEMLGKCEKFFLELMQVPRIESKLRVFSFKIQFQSQVSDLRKSLNAVNSVADQIRGSAKLKRIMQTILSLGNALNQGTARGSAVGFKLDSLLKLTDTRARNNKMTLMHYLCKVLADKLPELLDFGKDLSSLETASKIQLKFLAEEMQSISKGLEKVVQELSMSENDGPVCDDFRKALKEFLSFAEGEVRYLASLYSGVGRNVDALIVYFGEDPAKCPFEQVVSTLLNFVRLFNKSHEENGKQIELDRKKAEKELALEKAKMDSPRKNHEQFKNTPTQSIR